jgi:hypothetical protein
VLPANAAQPSAAPESGSPPAAAQQAVSKDIAGGGRCFFAQEALAAGTPRRLSVKLPERPGSIQAPAEVVWSEPYEIISKEQRHRSVEVGVKFLQIAPQDRETILQYIILERQGPRAASLSRLAPAAQPPDRLRFTT